MAVDKLEQEALRTEERSKERHRIRLLSSPDEEDTQNINARASERMAKEKSEPPPKDSIARQLVYVLNALPPWSRPFIVALLVVLLAGSGWSLASLTGMVK